MTTIATIELDRRMINLFIDMQSMQSQQTAKVYASTINGFTQRVAKPLAHVTVEDVHAYAQSLSHLAPSTQHRMLSTIKSFYRFLHSQPPYNTLPNAISIYKPIKLEQSDEINGILTKEEVDKVLDVMRYRNYRNWLIVCLLCSTGLRISELTSAKWDNVSLDFDGNIGLTVLGKGRKRRTVKLTKQVFSHIVSYRKQNGLNAEIGSGDTSPLFINRTGGHLTARYIEQEVTKAGELAKLTRPIHPHLFRHYNATMALYKGANIHIVQQSLGHSSIAVTNKYLYSLHKLNETTSDYIELDM